MREQVDELLPLSELRKGARVLDVGCGPGTICYDGFPHLRFFGVDQYAHARTGAWPVNGFLALADAEQLPWAAATFDAAICNFVFEHLHNPRPALRELDRVVRPGGLLYISIPRSSSLQDRLYRFTTKGGGHLQHYSFEAFIRLVYEETAFKLDGMAPAPGSFTWMQDMPYGQSIRALLFHSFRLWREATGHNPLASSDFLLLFRLGERRGLKEIRHVCSRCGNSHAELTPGAARSWRCAQCRFENMVVPA